MKDGRIRTIAQGSPVKDAIHEVSASTTASRCKPFSIEAVKESVPSAMNVKAAKMISKSNRLIKRSDDVRAAARDGRTTEDGTDCGACQQVGTNKKRNSKRKSKERQKAMTNKGSFGLFMAKGISETRLNGITTREILHKQS